MMDFLDAEEDFDEEFLDDDEFLFGEDPKRSMISFSCLVKLPP